MFRQIFADTGTLAQLLRTFNRISFNTLIESVTACRTDDVDELIADQVHNLEEEQRRGDGERLRALIVDIDRDMYSPSDAPSRLAEESANIRIPSTGLLQPVPTGTGNI